MLDHPFYHGLATDPRANIPDMYYSKQTQFYSLPEILDVMKSNQATIFDSRIHYQQVTKEIKEGKSPSRQQFDESLSLMAMGHHLGLNDVLSDKVNTLLARMMDCGIVNKIFSKYYMSDGK